MYAIYGYMVTFTINIPPMLAYIPYMDPMGYYLVNSGRSIGDGNEVVTSQSATCFSMIRNLRNWSHILCVLICSIINLVGFVVIE